MRIIRLIMSLGSTNCFWCLALKLDDTRVAVKGCTDSTHNGNPLTQKKQQSTWFYGQVPSVSNAQYPLIDQTHYVLADTPRFSAVHTSLFTWVINEPALVARLRALCRIESIQKILLLHTRPRRSITRAGGIGL